MSFAYDLGVGAYRLGILLASPFSSKAAAWQAGRKGLWSRIEKIDLRNCIWMHCASAGEFEQGLPVLENLKRDFPNRKILVTFFSPSGYEAKKNNPVPDVIEYLPLDTRANARKFVNVVKPSIGLFVKYEFWYHFLAESNKAKIPLFLVSGIFRQQQPFFKWYGGTHRKMLRFFDRIFVQESASQNQLEAIGITHTEVTGDTRFDRVAEIAKTSKELHLGKAFERASDLLTIVAGSTWPKDEEVIIEGLKAVQRPVRLMIAPHELEPNRLAELEEQLPLPKDRWSRLNAMLKGLFNPKDSGYPEPEQIPNGDPLDVQALLVDEMGLLSRLYRYGDIAFVGGGFGSGIHNTLEAAAHGKPVIFGPNHSRFAEAQGLIDAKAAWTISNAAALTTLINEMQKDAAGLKKAGENALRYVADNTGATARIVSVVKHKLKAR